MIKFKDIIFNIIGMTTVVGWLLWCASLAYYKNQLLFLKDGYIDN